MPKTRDETYQVTTNGPVFIYDQVEREQAINGIEKGGSTFCKFLRETSILCRVVFCICVVVICVAVTCIVVFGINEGPSVVTTTTTINTSKNFDTFCSRSGLDYTEVRMMKISKLSR